MERKNFMFRFGASCMVITILPASIILIIVLIPILISRGELDTVGIFATIGYVALFDLACFIGLVIIGFFVFRIENPDRLYEDEEFIDTKQFVKIKKGNIKYIKARRFIFLYAIDIMAKPWNFISSLIVYFNSKDEIVDFIKENDFIIKYIREKDLIKLGLKEDSYE